MSDPQRPSLPSSLRGVDAFQGPPAARRETTPASASPRPSSAADALRYPCPCNCECGNNTGVSIVEVVSPVAAAWLRCDWCLAAGHLDPKFNRAEPSNEISRAVRTSTVDAVEAEWDRRAAAEAEDRKWVEASRRWYEAMPARWKATRPDDKLEPQVEDRLARLATGEGLHGTGLLCVGSYGGGKTWAGFSYLREAVNRRLVWPAHIRYGREQDFFGGAAFGGFEAPRVMADLMDPKMQMFLIDDLGRGCTYRDEAHRHQLFTDFFDWVYANGKTLIISTNLHIGRDGTLFKHVGPAAYERMHVILGPDMVVREGNKRGELTALWEAEWQASKQAEAE